MPEENVSPIPKAREQQLAALKELVSTSTNRFLEMGSMLCHFLPNVLTGEAVQIAECVDRDGEEAPFEAHVHTSSREVMYQIRGETSFDDGTVLKEGELKVIEPNTKHKVTLKKGGAMIVIVHPPEPAYPKGV